MTTLPLYEGSKKHFSLTDNNIAFDDWSVAVDDLIGLSFGGRSATGWISSNGSYIHLHTNERKYTISNTNYGFAGNFSKNDNMQDILHAVLKHTTSPLFRLLLFRLFKLKEVVRIGNFQISSEIISANRFAREVTIPWSLHPTTRPVGRSSALLGRYTGGLIEVIYLHAAKGKMLSLGTTSSADMNGILLPHLCDFMRDRT
jgi:hypothetical protein